MQDGRLCYLDFGMCVLVAGQIRLDLIAAIVRLINRDYAGLGEDFVKLGFLPTDVDPRPIVPLLEKAFGDASSGEGLSDLSFSRLADNLSGLAFETPIRIPAFFTLVIRSLTILEGFALQTDASFRIVDESYPYVVGRVLSDDSPVLQKALQDILIDKSTGRLNWNRLNSLLTTRSASLPESHRKSSDRDKFALRASSRNSSFTSQMSDRALERVLDFVLSEKRGGFLRAALQLELTDTIDAAQLALAHRISAASNGVIPSPRERPDVKRLERAVSLVHELRVRSPALLLRPPRMAGDLGGMSDEHLQKHRRKQLTRQLLDTSRIVAANITDRNARRTLRKIIASIFGDDYQL